MDGANAEICGRNLSRWSGRCEVVEAAVWPIDGQIEYEWAGLDERSFRAQAARPERDPARRRARSVALSTLLERDEPGAAVDIVKMDIEGAEQQVLSENTEWAERVGAIIVESTSRTTWTDAAATSTPWASRRRSTTATGRRWWGCVSDRGGRRPGQIAARG